VELTTGFSTQTRETLIDLLGRSDLLNLRVSPKEAGRGRPAPDVLWCCAMHAQITSTSAFVALGDATSDMQTGVRAGAG
jgi:beta-phosphoglucomutase-like phosphatase (HAD superfamily)